VSWLGRAPSRRELEEKKIPARGDCVVASFVEKGRWLHAIED
jgi:hypothetical protein